MSSEDQRYMRSLKQYADEDNAKKQRDLHLIVQVKNKLIENRINPLDEEKAISFLNTLTTKEICLKIYKEYIITGND